MAKTVGQTISVALCTFNGAEYLIEQLTSIAAQAHFPDELVICDDASNDSTPLIIEHFSEKAPFAVKFYRNETRLGVIKNFEQAIGSCTSDLIALSDQDDIWLPEKLAIMLDRFNRDGELDALFSDAYLLTSTRTEKREMRLWDQISFSRREQSFLTRGRAMDVLTNRFVATGATMIFRRRLLDKIIPIPTTGPSELLHDGWIAIIAGATGKLRALNKATIFYRQHPLQAIGTPRPVGWLSKFNEWRGNNRARLYAELERRLKDTELLRATLVERVGPTAARDDLFQDKVDHLKQRLALSHIRLSRLNGVMKELSLGRYHRYSQRPWAVAFRDFVLPA